MRRFYLYRNEDETGISGTGAVAEGVQFSDGQVTMRWLSMTSSINIYRNIESLILVHGHNGKTEVMWLDKP